MNQPNITLPLVGLLATLTLGAFTTNNALSTELKIPDGIYHYGKSTKLDQPQSDYILFKVQNGQLIGTFYIPNSEYVCFTGGVSEQSLKVGIYDSSTQTIYPYSVALAHSPRANLANNNNQVTRRPLALAGYHKLEQTTPNQTKMLENCQKLFLIEPIQPEPTQPPQPIINQEIIAIIQQAINYLKNGFKASSF